jgi:hypothetical protein
MPTEPDPLKVHDRLYAQIGKLLDDLENQVEITFPQRLNALIAVGRILTIFATLRRAAARDNDTVAGSAVREYAAAFANANASGRRAPGAGTAADYRAEATDFDGGDADDVAEIDLDDRH